jgi:ABC-2 type transport system ATP-binding protein
MRDFSAFQRAVSMIEVQNLTKRYPTRVAVDDVTFSVKSGEIVGFLGPNGAGKTTTMRVLTGFLPPTSGSARVAGHDVVADSRKARAAVGYLPESAALYPEMRVREFLAYRARLEGVSGATVGQRVSEAIERCFLAEVAGRRIENLSKGFRQRTSLAGALVHQPPVLVLDEPTVGLDPMQIIKIREAIRALGKERAVLLSTHILPEVDAVCDRILIIAEGRIVGEGTAAQLRQKFASRPVLTAAFRGAVAAREALGSLPGVTAVEEQAGEKETRVRLECEPDADPSEAVYQMAVSRGWVLRELSRDQLSLEEVFVRLTQRSASAAATADEQAAPPSPLPSGDGQAEGDTAAGEGLDAARVVPSPQPSPEGRGGEQDKS